MSSKKVVSSNDNILSWIFGLAIIAFPLIKSESLIDYALLPREAFFFGVLLLISALFFAKKRAQFSLTIPMFLWLAFWLWTIVSHFSATNTAESIGAITRLSMTLSGIFIVYQTLKNKWLDPTVITKSFTLIGALLLAISTFKLLGLLSEGKLISGIYSVNPFFVHKNFLAAALLFTLPFIIINAFTSNHKGFSIFSKVLAVLTAVVLLLLQTRGVWIGLMGGIIISGISLFSNRSDENKKWVKRLGIFSGVVSIAFLVVALSSSSIFDSTNINSRFKMWDHGLKMANENPITGVGGGNWKTFYPKYGIGNEDRGVIEGITILQRPHNDFIWVVSEFGYPGLLFFTGFFIVLLITAWKNTKNGSKDSIWDYALLFGLVAYLAYSMGEFPLERPYHQMCLIFFTAFIMARSNLKKFKTGFFISTSLLAVLLVSGIYVTLERISGERLAKKALMAEQERKPQLMIQYANEAHSDYFSVDNYNNPVLYFSGMGNQALRQFDQSIYYFEKALLDNPYHTLTLNQLGNAYKLKGDIPQALKIYDRIVEFNPRNSTVLLNYAEIYLFEKDYEKASFYLFSTAVPENQEKQLRIFEGLMVSLRGKSKIGRVYYDTIIDLTQEMNQRDKNQLFTKYLNIKGNFIKQNKK